MIPSNEELKKLVDLLKTQARDTGVDQVLGVMTEVYAGAHARKEMLFPPLTVGDVRSIKGWWRCRWVVSQMYSMWCGRTMRMGLTMGGIDQHNFTTPEVMTMVSNAIAELSLPENENPILDDIIYHSTIRFGERPVDIEASKAMKSQMLMHMRMQGVPAEACVDDGKYD